MRASSLTDSIPPCRCRNRGPSSPCGASSTSRRGGVPGPAWAGPCGSVGARSARPGTRAQANLGSGGRVAEMSAGADEDVRTTESGIPLERVYGEDGRRRARPAGAARRARGVPLHPRHPSHDVPRPAVDDAPVRRLRHRRGDQRALPLPARGGRAGPLGRVRPAHPARHGLRRPPGGGRGGAGRRGDRLGRGHGAPVRRHPARPGLDQHDDQRPGGRAAAALPARGRGERGRARRAPRARSRTTC